MINESFDVKHANIGKPPVVPDKDDCNACDKENT